MSDRNLDVLTFSNCKQNYISMGRQLPRTPPSHHCVKHLNFESEEDQPLPQTCNEESQDLNSAFGFKTPPIKEGSSDDPQSMLKGMKGYQLRPADLEFMQKLKEEKDLKKLQDDLKDLQNVLKREMMSLELALASKEKALDGLCNLPSCEELHKWSRAVLEMTAPATEISDLDTKSLLGLVTKENATKAIAQKRVELRELEKMVEQKKKKDAKERGLMEKQIASGQSKIHSLMSKLVELKSALAQQEEVNKTLKTQQPPEMKGDTLKEEKAEPRRVKSKNRKQPAKTEQDATKPTRRTNNRNVVKEEPDESTTPETRRVRKPDEATQRKERTTTVRGRRKAAAAPGSQTLTKENKVETKVAPQAAPPPPPPPPARSRKRATVPTPAEEQHNAGLRRSKRIACQK